MATFSKSERISSKIVLDKVYNEGTLIKKYPFRLKYLKMDLQDGASVQIVVSVPKRIVKLATKRNRLRRQIKEIYRQNKSNLLSQYEDRDEGLALFLVYTGKENETYNYLEAKLKVVLKELESKL